MRKMLILLCAIIISSSAFTLAQDANPASKENPSTAPKNKGKIGPMFDTGTLTGKISFGEDTEIVQGVVSFFRKDSGPPPDLGSSRRVPERVARLHPEKGFKAQLAAGTYYIGAMQWKKGRRPGPPKADEKFIFIRDDQGNYKKIKYIVENKE